MTDFQKYVHLMSLVQAELPEHMAVMYAAMLGRPIRSVRIDTSGDGELVVEFVGGGRLLLGDYGRDCCESRYMTTDDDLSSFVGARIVGVEEVPVPDSHCDDGDTHEQVFVKLETTQGTITLVTHNEHNGYYGGFQLGSRWTEY